MQIVPWAEVRVCPMCLSSIKYNLSDLTKFIRINDRAPKGTEGDGIVFVLDCTCGYGVYVTPGSLPEEIYQLALNQCDIAETFLEYDAKNDKFIEPGPD